MIQGLQAALRKGKWTVTVAVHLGKQITGVWPGFKDQVFGLAVDIGSTTIAGHLCELSSGEVVASSGFMNPQIRFGEDLMSRVSYVMMNPGGEVEMTKAVRDGDQRPGRGGRQGSRLRRAGHPGGDLRRQSHHASPAAGD